MHVAEHLPPTDSLPAQQNASRCFCCRSCCPAARRICSSCSKCFEIQQVRFNVAEFEGPGEFLQHSKDAGWPLSKGEAQAEELLQRTGPLERQQVQSLVEVSDFSGPLGLGAAGQASCPDVRVVLGCHGFLELASLQSLRGDQL